MVPQDKWTEADWYRVSREEAIAAASAHVAYAASKALAERAAWAFVQQHHPSFDLVSIIPPAIYGPAVIRPASPTELPSSLSAFYAALTGEEASKTLGAYVDIQ